ncbi:hypothetical protein ACFQ6U_18845 [Streptomyces sp. NPDC056465]|uniref:hypothetical protein n=1 Tax=Streptomyces sp. NPDC056465 TaxID=3345829 RepID=UPI0036BB135E
MDHIARLVRVVEAVDAVVSSRPSKAVRLMEEISTFSSTEEMYGVCRLLAEMGRQLLVQIHDPASGQPWEMKEPEPHGRCHPAHVFSVRFITAYANDQDEQCKALFAVLLDAEPQEFTDGIMALLVDIGDLSCRVLQQRPSS